MSSLGIKNHKRAQLIRVEYVVTSQLLIQPVNEIIIDIVIASAKIDLE